MIMDRGPFTNEKERLVRTKRHPILPSNRISTFSNVIEIEKKRAFELSKSITFGQRQSWNVMTSYSPEYSNL